MPFLRLGFILQRTCTIIKDILKQSVKLCHLCYKFNATLQVRTVKLVKVLLKGNVQGFWVCKMTIEMIDKWVTTENAYFRTFITLRSQFHQHHCSQRTLTEIVSKITPKPLDLSFNVHRNRRLIRDGSPGRPPRLSHSSRALPLAEAATSILFVGTKLNRCLSRQKYACHDKTCVATKAFCCDKNILSPQTLIILSWQK